MKPGDDLVVPKSNFQIAAHHAVYLGQNYYGTDLFCENNNVFGVRLVTAEQFFRENLTYFRIDRFPGNNFQRQLAVKRALNKLGQHYSLINFNCEHFATYVQTGNPRSKQVENVGKGLLVAAILAIIIGGAASS